VVVGSAIGYRLSAIGYRRIGTNSIVDKFASSSDFLISSSITWVE
jgi:hypothetical protein|tara:strand:- start:524 stop:658 length:135 start_codon:yes stop_codon:yes gene_type:complete